MANSSGQLGGENKPAMARLPAPSIQALARTPPRRQLVEPRLGLARALVSPRAAAVPAIHPSFDGAPERSFVYRFLAKAYEKPTPAGWRWLCQSSAHLSLLAALRSRVPLPMAHAQRLAKGFTTHLHPGEYERFLHDYISVFDGLNGQVNGGRVAGIHRRDGDPLQRERLIEREAFFSAFGLRLQGEEPRLEAQLGIELEFMSLLTARQAFGADPERQTGQCALFDDAQRLFLREHLGAWGPEFCGRLAEHPRAGLLAPLARLTGSFLREELKQCELSA